MFAKLTALVGGGYTFGYNVSEEPYPDAWGQWTHHQGTSKEDGSPVSVFKMMAADPNDRRLACARNGVKRLKMASAPSKVTHRYTSCARRRVVLQLVRAPLAFAAAPPQCTGLQGQHGAAGEGSDSAVPCHPACEATEACA